VSKLITIEDAMGLINDGDILGIGGNVLHRAPMALVREIVRTRKKKLKAVKTAGAMDVDMLCFGECLESVDAGFVSYESEFSLANHYRKAVQDGRVKGNEHACYTVMCALRASACGVPFMPVRGLVEGDLIEVNDYFTRIDNPFGSEKVTVVRAITPDVTIIHVQEADDQGNVRIQGPAFDDILLAKASKKVIVSAEKIISRTSFLQTEDKADIPHFMVSAVVHIPEGANPCSCAGHYDIDRKSIDSFKQLKDISGLTDYLAAYEKKDRGNGNG
jgi:glutaconate CoA-transferase subunit A